MCNAGSQVNETEGPTAREKELIQRLEEATDEIDALLKEKAKLIKLSNESKFQLTSCAESFSSSPEHDVQSHADEYEQALLDEILNDQS